MKNTLFICLVISFVFTGCSYKKVTNDSEAQDLVLLGKASQAQSITGEIDPFFANNNAEKHWKETLDNGDDPTVPGCACNYQLDGCGGEIIGRAVDECFPDDGVSLHEKDVSKNNCDDYNGIDYNCEKLLGKGATCKLIELTCCGVKTTSGYCNIDIEN